VSPAPDRDTPRTTPTSRAATLAGLGLVVLAAGCGSAGADHDAGGADETGSGQLLVSAAASLTDAFGALGEAFEDEHPEVEVVLNLAGSQTLANQIVEGAPADVFASADPTQMDAVADAGHLADDPEVFTTNRLAIAVEPGNPRGIDGLADLDDPSLLLVLPDEAVPAGGYAREALDAAGVEVAPASLEQDVRAALSKVELGEADAAIVYASDLDSATDRVTGVEVPADENVVASYPIARLDGASDPPAADAFVAFVLADPGQAILADHGFTAP
jgi:molybdate transport system substrate-binding protein